MIKNFKLPPVIVDVAQDFAAHGFELSLVGGSVRDIFLARKISDYDLTTSALPAQTLPILKRHVKAVYDIGKQFGTIGGKTDEFDIEITTYRADEYDGVTRKPVVSFGDNLKDDLARRDFTVNAMAFRLPDMEFTDYYGGLSDLNNKLLRTPIDPEVSFSDDPLRMIRAIRFIAQLEGNWDIEMDTAAAICDMKDQLGRVSKERIRDEFSKLMLGADPIRGIRLLVDSGLVDFIAPEVPALKLEIDPEHRHKDVYEHTLKVISQAMDMETDENGPVPAPDLTLRLACLFHDIGKPKTRRFEGGGKVSFYGHDAVGAKITRRILRNLRFERKITDDVCKLVELHMRFHGYSDSVWTDGAIRRYVRDAGDMLERLHRLTRADVTTRNRQLANKFMHAYDDLEYRIDKIKEQEELSSIRPDLDGSEIMEILNLTPSPLVGKAYKYMLGVRLDEGPLSKAEAKDILLKWAKDNL
jgi:poly(A) polymerase